MRALRHIVFFCLLLLAQWIGAANLISTDPYWVGSNNLFGTTEGSDYWVTFMPNNQKDTNNVTLNLRIYAVSSQATTIKIEDAEGNSLGSINLSPNVAGVSGPLDPKKVYLNRAASNPVSPKGVHIYSSNKSATFSCFALSEAGEGDGTTRDLALLIPTKYLAQEYYIQTYPDDAEATEFAVVAIEDEDTKITVSAKNGATVTKTLKKGEVYLARAATNLSGSTVCADKPVAVFQGNESAKIASGGAASYSANHLFEQTAPKTTWGTEFYFSLTEKAKSNAFFITATADGTTVTVHRKGNYEFPNTFNLNAGQSIPEPLYLSSALYTDVTITSNKPIMCSSYLTCGGVNDIEVIDPGTGNLIRQTWGNPTNAMMPDWNLRTTEMNFYTDFIANETGKGEQAMYVQVIAKTTDIYTVTLDNNPVSTEFSPMNSSPEMSVANIALTNAGMHTLRSGGDGFIGFVYSLTSEARAYQYTLGYNLEPYRDSIFVTNSDEVLMSSASYHVKPADYYGLEPAVPLPQGWYQRQLDEWSTDHERIDTAYVCDKTTVKWGLEIAAENPADTINWYIYDVTGKTPKQKAKKEKGKDKTYSYKFSLPSESNVDPEERKPYRDYEVQAILIRNHIVCTDDVKPERDTMRAAVRVFRDYRDTTYMVMCLGDTVKFFYDSLPKQGGMYLDNDDPHVTRSLTPDSTSFHASPTTQDFEWQVQPGENVFTRHYTTKYGCDSLSTIYLFVCDTFRQVDEYNLISNDKYDYHGMRYIGEEYYEQHPSDPPKPKDVPILNDTVVFVKFKTKACDCQLNDKYPPFTGCDSIYELHIRYHNTFFQADSVQVCDNHIEILTPKDRPGISYSFYGKNYTASPTPGAYEIYSDTIVTDSLLTKNLPARDSVYWAYAFLNPTYKIYDTLHVCDNKSVTWNVTPARTYKGSDYTDDYEHTDVWEGLTKNCGCDSIRYLKLYVHKTFYQEEDSVDCQDINNTRYVWKNHENRRLYDVNQHKWIQASSINLKTAGEYTYIDSLINPECKECGSAHGCDSVYVLHLTINPTYSHLQITDATTCQNEPYTWREHTYRNLRAGMHTFHDEFTTKNGGCDSSFTLNLRVDTAYLNPVENTPRYMCDKDTLHYYNIIYRGEKSTHTTPNVIKIPEGQSYTSKLTPEHTDKTIHDCDSVVRHQIFVYRTYLDTTHANICQNDPFTWLNHEGHTVWDVHQGKRVNASDIPTNKPSDGHYYYIDSLKTKNCNVRQADGTCGCDSIWVLDLYIPPSYKTTNTIHLCAHDTVTWQDTLLIGSQFVAYGGTFDDTKPYRIFPHGTYNRTRWYPTVNDGCDSIFELYLTVDSLYREVFPYRQCQLPGGTYYYKYLNNGAGGDLPAEYLYQSLTRNDTLHYTTGCDSLIVTLDFHVDSVYRYEQSFVVPQTKDSIWEWKNQFGDLMDKISLDEGNKTIHIEKNPKTIYECDSIFALDLYIAPTYYIHEPLTICENDSVSWQHIMFTGREFSAYNPGGYDPTPYTKTRDHLTAGIYYDTVKYTTTPYGYDSIYYLTLTIHPVKRVQDTIRVCQEPNGTYRYKNQKVDILLPAEHLSDSTKRVDTLTTTLGCDSIVGMVFYVDSVYDYRQTVAVCQDTVNSFWEWFDEFGESRGYIDISDSGNFVYEDRFTTIHKCDSTYTINLRVKPIYRFDSVYSICDNERIRWQNKWYCGNKYPNPMAGDSILQVGICHDTVRYNTIEGCENDSTYILVLHVHPTFATPVRVHVCDNEDKHSYTFSDTHGNRFEHYIPFAPWYNDDEHKRDIEGVTKPDKDTIIVDTLYTVYGCDSIITFHLTVHPTYFFETDEKVCIGTTLDWHGRTIKGSGIYYDSLTTKYGCDSIYMLEFYVKPYMHVPVHDMVCENHIYYHRDTLRHDNGVEHLVEYEVWHPGAKRPDETMPYIPVAFKGVDGCDSIEYQYYLNICPVYNFDGGRITLCSGDTAYSETLDHAWSDWAIEFDVDTFVKPYDTLFIDSLQTVMGCDSVYKIEAHVLPAYRHIDYDTICSNTPYIWRNKTITDLIPGKVNHIFDPFRTVAHNCDSIYELQLMVNAIFVSEDTVKLCADDSIEWRGQHIANLLPREEEYFFFDSLQTVNTLCDSVYHLYVLALDTTMEENFDTICYNDTLTVLEHQYTTTGNYKDTTLNEDGCHHFIYTHLTVIPPTVPTLVSGSLCNEDNALELAYTYSSHFPITYSLYFDSLGYDMGLDSIVDAPITEYTDTMVITVPLPTSSNTPSYYPRPDVYGFRLILDNGLCQRPKEDCFVDSTFTVSYPSWILEQHYNDVIALLDSAHNGGYTFTAYQWYKGDSMLVGQTKPYLHIPTGLELGETYHVNLTRAGEEQAFQTCPITIESFISDPYAPTMGYLSVTPTCVTTSHPYVNILSHSPTTEATGTYRVTTMDGYPVTEGVFHADVTQVELPNIEGMYIFQLWSNDTPEEPYRAIKVIVRQQCPNCDISSF